MVKMKREIKILIGSAVTVAVLLITMLTLYFTGAWFFSGRTAEGVLNFQQGIKIDYSGVYFIDGDGSDADFNFQAKLSTEDNWSELSEANVLKIKSDSVATVNNPTFTAKEGTTDFYLRAKYDVKFYFNNNNIETEVTDANIATFLAKLPSDQTTAIIEQLAGITTKEQMIAVIFNYFPEIADGWTTVGEYMYYTGDNTGATLAEKLETVSAGNIIKLFKTETDGTVKLALDDAINFGIELPFTKITFDLNVEAREAIAHTVELWG